VLSKANLTENINLYELFFLLEMDGEEKMQAIVFPSSNSIRITYVDDRELQAILDALQGISCRIQVNRYRG